MRQMVLTLLLLCVSVHLDAQSVIHRLQDVKIIYVKPLGGTDIAAANLINAKLVTYLAKHHDISVVETAENADAILTGTAVIQNSTNSLGQATIRVQATMRLDNKEGVVLWADDISNSPFASSASSSLAENVANKLVKAILADGDRK